ncbi:hypothetical protein B296_00005136 [Ensete ventricosum]|uniref:Uncharacterized protein n=1 Tax=Ensete ventricosum TaxID=4639 RepID=A0A427A716_ENSVE|nr:hypothetical protein B296_00005136 [Ensete ventricosum]
MAPVGQAASSWFLKAALMTSQCRAFCGPRTCPPSMPQRPCIGWHAGASTGCIRTTQISIVKWETKWDSGSSSSSGRGVLLLRGNSKKTEGEASEVLEAGLELGAGPAAEGLGDDQLSRSPIGGKGPRSLNNLHYTAGVWEEVFSSMEDGAGISLLELGERFGM